MSGKINLLPNAAKFKAYRQLLRVLNKKIIGVEVGVGVVVAVLVLGVSAVVGIMSSRSEGEMKRWKQEYSKLGAEVEASQKIKYQAKIVGKVLDDRFEYGQAFGAVGKLFPPEVMLEKSDFKDENSFNLSGVILTDAAVETVEDIVTEINKGRNEHFTKMELNKMVWNNTGWTFDAVVYLKTS